MRRPIGLTVPYREVGYKEKKEWEIKRPWVGLTEEERKNIWTADQMTAKEWDELFNTIEAKLKEKNT